MKRYIRIGITHPLVGEQNNFIRPEDMRGAIQRLCSFRTLFDEQGVSPGLDCGFPFCRFTSEEIDWLNGFEYPPGFQCGPGPDIAPDLSVFHCLPLASYSRRSLREFRSLKEMNEHFQQIHKQIGKGAVGIFDECDGCRHREKGICSGGGRCQILHRRLIGADKS